MKIRIAATALALTSLLAIAACDSRDNAAELAALQAEAQDARGEAEQLQTQLDELRAEAEAQPEAMAEGTLENVQTALNDVAQTTAATFERIGSMTEEPDASAEQRTEALGVLREDLQKIMQSVQAAATDLGIELDTVAMDTDADATEGTPEPAAGPETQEQPATAQ
jgi:predicted  nucleic acid-binding Zn-ribbon protein